MELPQNCRLANPTSTSSLLSPSGDEAIVDDTHSATIRDSFDKKLYSCRLADPSFELFILSEAGKPIYSYTRRDDIITLMPVCQALMSVARSSQDDTLHSIITSSKIKINFTTRSPLIIVVISRINSSVEPRAVIGQVEAQIASILTLKSLKNLFDERPTFDLKRLLQGSEKLIDSTIHLTVSMLDHQQRRALPPPNLFGHHYQDSGNYAGHHNQVEEMDRQKEDDENDKQNYMNAQSDYLYQNHADHQWPWSQAFLCCGNTANQKSTSQPELNTILVPIVVMPSSKRDQIHAILSSSVSASSTTIIFTLLFKVIGSNRSGKIGSSSAETLKQDAAPSSVRRHSEEVKSNTSSVNDNTNKPTDETKNVDQSEIVDDPRMDNIRFELVTISNHHSAHKISPLDTHLLLALLNGSKNQLLSVESLWMPVCLPRFNATAFLHTHISCLKNGFCLVILTVDREEFSNCQTIKLSIEDKLIKLLNKLEAKSSDSQANEGLSPPMLQSNSTSGSQQSQPTSSKETTKVNELLPLRQLQFLWYQTQRQVLMLQQSPSWTLSPLVYYIARRMSQSKLKTLWLKSENDKVILGWHVSTFQLYAQFDATISPGQALEAVHVITNWIKKEEDNFSLRDYK